MQNPYPHEIPSVLVDEADPLRLPVFTTAEDDILRLRQQRQRNAMIAGFVTWWNHGGVQPFFRSMFHRELLDTTARRVFRQREAVEQFMKRLFPEPEKPARLSPYARGKLRRPPLPA